MVHLDKRLKHCSRDSLVIIFRLGAESTQQMFITNIKCNMKLVRLSLEQGLSFHKQK